MMGEKEYKVCLCGDSGVGKTSITARYVWGNLNSTKATIGLSMLTKMETVDGRSLTLNIWDTAGQERYRSLIPLYFRDTVAVIIVFDVTRKTSFENLRMWFDIVKNTCRKDVILALAGNKCDLTDVRAVPHQDVIHLATELNVPVFETSAQTGDGVDEVFKSICSRIPPEPVGPADTHPVIWDKRPSAETNKTPSCCVTGKQRLK